MKAAEKEIQCRISQHNPVSDGVSIIIRFPTEYQSLSGFRRSFNQYPVSDGVSIIIRFPTEFQSLSGFRRSFNHYPVSGGVSIIIRFPTEFQSLFCPASAYRLSSAFAPQEQPLAARAVGALIERPPAAETFRICHC
ncbi:MAG: hypothetical protein IKQ54_03375, partial [Oscillospiraceae bacterium]|nr:hypothetical protein [Oscillospiraceae bacterium]